MREGRDRLARAFEACDIAAIQKLAGEYAITDLKAECDAAIDELKRN